MALQDTTVYVMQTNLSIMAEDDPKVRAGALFHSIDRVHPGDHIYVYSDFMLHTYHGIFIGEDGCEVIHFPGAERGDMSGATIQKTSLSDFCRGAQLRLAAYDCWSLTTMLKRRKTCYVDSCRPAEEVIETAKYYLSSGKWPNYEMDSADFAYHCKTGKSLILSRRNGTKVAVPGPRT